MILLQTSAHSQGDLIQEAMLKIFCLLSCMSLAGCSSSGSSAADFVGTWQIVQGTGTENCGGTVSAIPQTGSITIAAGTVPNTVVTTDVDGCTNTFTVSGTSATASNQRCTATSVTGVTIVQTTNLVLTLSGSAMTRSESQTLLESKNGQSVTCTVTATDTLTQVGT